mmetsp:Transcript_9260/g.28709  ORF Transcript_9260/g.28709 Transcript_9260/m.28709 type:complete len:534 (-) Transcript_9260:116-1717(-)
MRRRGAARDAGQRGGHRAALAVMRLFNAVCHIVHPMPRPPRHGRAVQRAARLLLMGGHQLRGDASHVGHHLCGITAGGVVPTRHVCCRQRDRAHGTDRRGRVQIGPDRRQPAVFCCVRLPRARPPCACPRAGVVPRPRVGRHRRQRDDGRTRHDRSGGRHRHPTQPAGRVHRGGAASARRSDERERQHQLHRARRNARSELRDGVGVRPGHRVQPGRRGHVDAADRGRDRRRARGGAPPRRALCRGRRRQRDAARVRLCAADRRQLGAVAHRWPRCSVLGRGSGDRRRRCGPRCASGDRRGHDPRRGGAARVRPRPPRRHLSHGWHPSLNGAGAASSRPRRRTTPVAGAHRRRARQRLRDVPAANGAARAGLSCRGAGRAGAEHAPPRRQRRRDVRHGGVPRTHPAADDVGPAAVAVRPRDRHADARAVGRDRPWAPDEARAIRRGCGRGSRILQRLWRVKPKRTPCRRQPHGIDGCSLNMPPPTSPPLKPFPCTRHLPPGPQDRPLPSYHLIELDNCNDSRGLGFRTDGWRR